MNFIALKMLFGDRAKYIGIVNRRSVWILPRCIAGHARFDCTHTDTDPPVALVNELVDLTTIYHLSRPLSLLFAVKSTPKPPHRFSPTTGGQF